MDCTRPMDMIKAQITRMHGYLCATDIPFFKAEKGREILESHEFKTIRDFPVTYCKVVDGGQMLQVGQKSQKLIPPLVVDTPGYYFLYYDVFLAGGGCFSVVISRDVGYFKAGDEIEEIITTGWK